jgi:hypothetical protein
MNGADSNKENGLQVDVHLQQMWPAGSGPRTFKFDQRWLQASTEGTEALKSGSFKDEQEW